MTVNVAVWGAVLFGLVFFGLWYNVLVAGIEAQNKQRGFVSFLVVLGDFVAVLGFTIAAGSLLAGVVMLSCLAAAGLPMVVGSVRRYVQARSADEARCEEQVRASYE